MRNPMQYRQTPFLLSKREANVFLLFWTGILCISQCFETLRDVPSVNWILLLSCSYLAYFALPLSRELIGIDEGIVFLVSTALSWATVLLAGFLLSAFSEHGDSVSESWLLGWYFAGLAVLFGIRPLALWISRSLPGRFLRTRRVVLVGYGVTGRELVRRASHCAWRRYELRAIHVGENFPVKPLPPGVDEIFRLEDVAKYVAENMIDEIWIALPIYASADLLSLQSSLSNVMVDVRFVPDTQCLKILSNRAVDFFGFSAVDLNQPKIGDSDRLLKSFFDRIFAAIVLLLLSPLLLAIAACVRISSPGPVIFRQKRLGLNGRIFNIYKFRSMRVHCDDGAIIQARLGDERVTSIGRFLRRTSLDELPQFINVLKGEMSVVGPRPHAIHHNEIFSRRYEGYMLRHRVRPGITGWAQINGWRGETDTEEKITARIKFDLAYIENWSFWLDIRIITWTAIRGWTGKFAY
ncbi:undecaprenyl-phosphate glucose phosphotransferase [Pseudoduganella namucuonensis]|uniref:Putative colanic acid biosysnthesis UDP-glucose lipid carrier transferase n=1 Tax=Pseudoduganella namucuonensis TaxID=1035707 RepID=A0A1I7M525_9BURK|nr:undecaprenyl-phosphate glucose phosphotransferase [Pseudoduganella namucuonensis]SFV17042.1 putative colanic acid biosysnthesis UDP-glucose lipid carrier transferase [Pseudoduganella namucuonensis]